MICETPEIYTQITKPKFIDLIDHKQKNGWLYNVLDGTKEVENQIYNDNEFMLSKDWEFNEGDVQTLYCLAIPKQTDLFTIRDLTIEHLPMLKNIREKSLQAINKRFGLPQSQIRSFFHYQPTYYHLHVHFIHTRLLQKASAHVGRAILLDDVIDNIENFSPDKKLGNYYQQKTLTFEVKQGTKLHDIY